ncbi:MAG: FtsX-like permease family protein [Cyclonatronaceae bacterium]
MNVLFSISWRNIWRHPARSGILIAAIVAGTWAGILTAGWANGLVEQRIEYLIGTELSHVQVHHPEYQMEREPWMTLSRADSVMAYLREDERVASFAPRTLAEGLARSPVTTGGVRIRGVDPEMERATTTLHERVVEGEWLDADVRNPVLIGRKLSEKLGLDIGHRLVLQFQDLDNRITAGAFSITGLFQSASSDYDERNVLVRSEDLSELVAGHDVYHELAITVHHIEDADTVAADLNTRFPGNHTQTWFELSPEIRYMSDWGGIMTYILMVIIMMALSFGILNTMLMAIFERMREIGMLLSIGMNRSRVFMMIMLEALMLTLGGALAGFLLSWITLGYLSSRGVDMSMFSEGLAEFGFDPVTYPFVTPGEYAGITVIVILAALLASVYPAIKAIRVNPVEASRD